MRNLGKVLVALLVLTAGPLSMAAQFLLEFPDGDMTISGRLRAAYKLRFNFPGDEKSEESGFYVHQARLRFGGNLHKIFEYDIHLEFRSHNVAMEAKDVRVTYRLGFPFELTACHLTSHRVLGHDHRSPWARSEKAKGDENEDMTTQMPQPCPYSWRPVALSPKPPRLLPTAGWTNGLGRT